jgi:hypothetical protein
VLLIFRLATSKRPTLAAATAALRPGTEPAENIWEYLRGNALSNCVWETYEAILDACCGAWNALMAKSNVITSIGTREWAQVRI